MTALVRVVSGLVLWAVDFSTLYALHGLGCSSGWTGSGTFGLSWAKLLLLAVWISLIGTHCILLRWLVRRKDTQMERIGIAIGWIGLGATVVTGAPIVVVSSCV